MIKNILGIFNKIDDLYENGESKGKTYYEFFTSALRCEPGKSDSIRNLRGILTKEINALSEEEYQEYRDQIDAMYRALNDLDIWYENASMSGEDYGCNNSKELLMVISELVSDVKSSSRKVPEHFLGTLMGVALDSKGEVIASTRLPFRYIRYENGILKVSGQEPQSFTTIVERSCLLVKNRGELLGHIRGAEIYIKDLMEYHKESIDMAEETKEYQIDVGNDVVRRLKEVYSKEKKLCNAAIFLIDKRSGIMELELTDKVKHIRISGGYTSKTIREEITGTTLQVIAVA